MRDTIIIMQKQRSLITCTNHLFKPFNNRFRSKQHFSHSKVQSTAKKFKELSASVCIRISFDEMQSSFAIFNDRRGLAVLFEDVTVQLVKELVRFCACELIVCGITSIEVERLAILQATGMDFIALFFSEMAHESCRCSSSFASS